MDIQELLRKVKQIEIKAKMLSEEVFAGKYHSAFKGQGVTFAEVREYVYGDDIRTIDWKVTARFDHPYVKVFEEERELTVLLLIDVSGSADFGSVMPKREYIALLSAVLAYSAMFNNDKVGVIFFSEQVEKFIPPKKGRRHVLRIIREILSFKPEFRYTDIKSVLYFLVNAIKKSAVVFLISDFLDSDVIELSKVKQNSFTRLLAIASKKHDLIAIKVMDWLEENVPNLGIVNAKDAETLGQFWVDTSSKRVREAISCFYYSHSQIVKDVMVKNGIDFVELKTNEDFSLPLNQVFKKRRSRW